MYSVLKDRDVDKIIKHLDSQNKLFIETETNRRINIKNKLILRNLIFNKSIFPYGELDDDKIVNFGILNLSSENLNKNYITVQFLELEDNEFVKKFLEFAEDYCKKNNFGKIKLIINEETSGEKLTQILEVIETNGFKKELEYECILGKQMLYAQIISGDENADN